MLRSSREFFSLVYKLVIYFHFQKIPFLHVQILEVLFPRGCIIRNSINNNEKELNASWTDRKKERKKKRRKFQICDAVRRFLLFGSQTLFYYYKEKANAFCSSTCSRWRLHRDSAVKVKRRDPANPTSTGFFFKRVYT